MTMLETFSACVACAWSLSHSVIKVAYRWWWGACEIERICNHKKRPHDSDMSIAFLRCLSASKQLQTCHKLVYFHRPFSVSVAVECIVVTKRLDRSKRYLIANLSCCLRDLRYVNLGIFHLERQRKTVFVSANTGHTALLEKIWSGLMPDQRFPGIVSVEWEAAGWQGRDPSTDLRGMGLLALELLSHFATAHQPDARRCLKLSLEPYFPFCATGVVIGSFCMDLLLENRLHPSFLRRTQSSFDVQGTDVTAEEAKQAQVLIGLFHDLFSDMYIQFVDYWISSSPSSVMDFPRIWIAFQNNKRVALPTY